LCCNFTLRIFVFLAFTAGYRWSYYFDLHIRQQTVWGAQY
jgi:hypothetical protein